MIALHIAGVYYCFKKRNIRNKVKEYMKIRQIMYNEHLVSMGVARDRAARKPLTVHV